MKHRKNASGNRNKKGHDGPGHDHNTPSPTPNQIRPPADHSTKFFRAANKKSSPKGQSIFQELPVADWREILEQRLAEDFGYSVFVKVNE